MTRAASLFALTLTLALAAVLQAAPAVPATPAAGATTGPGGSSPLARNAALYYWKAFAATPGSREDWYLYLRNPINCHLTETSKAIVEATAPAMKLLLQGSQFDQVEWGNVTARPPADAPPGVPANLLRPDNRPFQATEAHRLAPFALISARMKIEEGKYDEGFAQLVAILRLARHVGVMPDFTSLSESLGIESQVVEAAAPYVLSAPDKSLEQFADGLAKLPEGGSMRQVLGQSRTMILDSLVQGLAKAPDNAVAGVLNNVLGPDQGKQFFADCGKDPAEVVATIEDLKRVSDRCAKLMDLPDSKMAQFNKDLGPVLKEMQQFHKDHPKTLQTVPALAMSINVVDRFLDARNRAATQMLRAAVAYKLGGPDGAAKIPDPYSATPREPFTIEKTDDGIEITSALKVIDTIITHRFAKEAPVATQPADGKK